MAKKKARVKVDRSAAIQRGKARKERNIRLNEDRHLDNLHKLEELGVAAQGHRHRPSVMVRLATRAAAQLRMENSENSEDPYNPYHDVDYPYYYADNEPGGRA